MNLNLDRFSQGRSDPVEELPITECSVCGYEIYRGNEYFEVDGEPVCIDTDCLAKKAGAERRTA